MNEIVYLNGLKGRDKSGTQIWLEQNCGEDFEVFAIHMNADVEASRKAYINAVTLLRIDQTVENIYVVANSFGCFIDSLCSNFFDLRRLYINPCLMPTRYVSELVTPEELTKIAEYEQKRECEEQPNLMALVGTEDELVTHGADDLKEVCGIVPTFIPTMHRLSDEQRNAYLPAALAELLAQPSPLDRWS